MRCLVGAVALLTVLPIPVRPQEPTAGFLFAYRPHPGERAAFEEGYRTHLDWHREKEDSLPWYGWEVIAGPGTGLFLDGSFGISFAALDRRVDPGGDAAHASRSFLPHAESAGRWAVRLRPELSTATPLEAGSPRPLAQVVRYVLPPGRQTRLEEILRGVRAEAPARDLLPYTVYETVVGASDAELTVLVWRDGMASFDRAERDPTRIVRRALDGEIASELRTESELWRNRPDLTLVPDGGEDAGEPESHARSEANTRSESASVRRASWSTVTPGGGTGCAFGDPFEFWVREGRSDELMLYLQGGGACFSHDTCHPEGGLQFDPEITVDDHAQRRHGVFDASNPDNPFRRATVVFIPYCTGDFHLGARSATYGAPPGSPPGSVTVEHLGYRNSTAVLDHLEVRGVAPSRITVVGASAGAVASPVLAARVAERFPRAVVRQIGDGAAGLRFAGSRDLLRRWGALEALVADGYDVPPSGDAFTALYRMAAAEHPRIRFSQVATASDARVAEGLRLVGEAPESVHRRIGETYVELEEAGVCFRGWILPGTAHTILWRSAFFSARVGGVPLPRRLRDDVLDRPCPAPRSGRQVP